MSNCLGCQCRVCALAGRPCAYWTSLRVLQLAEETTSAVKSGCEEAYCFIISDKLNNADFRTQENAQRWCRNNNSGLAEIINDTIQSATVNFIRRTYGDNINTYIVFIGGRRSSGNWVRLNGKDTGSISFPWYSDKSYSFGFLRSLETGFNVDCTRPTDGKKNFICSGVFECNGGSVIDSQCYMSYSDAMTWYEARNKCLEKKGDLASFDNITTNDGFRAMNVSGINAQNEYWIGFRKESWTWQETRDDIKYTQWHSNHPVYYYSPEQADCLCLYADNWHNSPWKWIECKCDNPNLFICLSEIQSSTVSTSKYSSSSSSSSSTSSSASIKSPGSFLLGRGSESTPATFGSTQSNSITNFAEINKSGLNYETKVGIGVGIGVGGFVLLSIAAVLIVIVRRYCLQTEKGSKEEPNISGTISGHDVTEDVRSSNEDPYAVVAKSETANLNTDEIKSQTVYQKLDFLPTTDAANVTKNAETTPTPNQPAPNSESEYYYSYDSKTKV